jgi:3-oxoacyl-[acyl-carrier protein] reductase
MQNESFSGRVVFVTGGGRNLGHAIALAFAEAGAGVAIAVRSNVAEGESAVADFKRVGAEAMLTVGDVADPDVCASMVRSVVDTLGPIDILINAVGYRPHKLLSEVTPAEWRLVFDTNCSSAFYLSQAVLPSMVERGFGRIIALGGSGPGRAGPKHAHISVSKAGLSMLMSEIAREYGPLGVTANTIVPGAMDTKRDKVMPNGWPPPKERLAERMAVPRLGRPSEIAAACLYLSSEGGAFVTGQRLRVDGGAEMG